MANEQPENVQALMETVQGLAQTVQLLLQQVQQNNNPQQVGPITDFYHTDQAFDLSRSSSAYAYGEACKGLPEESKWRGNPSDVAPWITSLRNLCSSRGLDRPLTSVIRIDLPAEAGANPAPAVAKDLFSLQVTLEEATRARAFRDNSGNARAIQNSRILFEIIKASIGEPLYSSIFREVVPEDGPTLFVMVTRRSSVTALSTAMNAEEQLKTLDPSSFKFDLIAVNTKITQLFDQAAIVMPLSDAKKRICILSIYNKIKEPSEWHQWVSRMTENIEDSTPANVISPDDLMAKAETKVSNIQQMPTNPWKQASTITQWQQVVALVNKKNLSSTTNPKGNRRTNPTKPEKDGENDDPNATQKRYPPFVTHWKDKSSGKSYKKGDTKQWEGETWYYCPCKHRPKNNRWHKHKPQVCTVLKRYEQGQTNSESSSGTSNRNSNRGQETPSTSSSKPKDKTLSKAFLSAMLNETSDPDLQEKYAQALHDLE